MSSNERLADLNFGAVLPEVTVYVYDNKSPDNTVEAAKGAGAIFVRREIVPAALQPDGSLEGLNRQQMSRSCANSWPFGRDPFARPPDRQAAA